MKQKFDFENTMVYLIDTEALAKNICEELEYDSDLVIKQFNGMILEPKVCLVCTEIVAHLVDKDGTLTIDLYPPDHKVVTKDGNFATSISMFPKMTCKLTPDEIYPFLKDNPITLAEFTKGRRGYNGRLERNEYELVKYLNEKKTKKTNS